MKINGLSDTTRIESLASKPAAAGNAKPATAPDPVRLTGLTARGNADSGPAGEFDSAKVESIKQAIREGRFEVDSGLVADRLLASVHELLGKSH